MTIKVSGGGAVKNLPLGRNFLCDGQEGSEQADKQFLFLQPNKLARQTFATIVTSTDAVDDHFPRQLAKRRRQATSTDPPVKPKRRQERLGWCGGSRCANGGGAGDTNESKCAEISAYGLCAQANIAGWLANSIASELREGKVKADHTRAWSHKRDAALQASRWVALANMLAHAHASFALSDSKPHTSLRSTVRVLLKVSATTPALPHLAAIAWRALYAFWRLPGAAP